MTEEAVPGRSNGYDPVAVKSFVERFENLDEQLEEVKEEHKADLKILKQEAKDSGIPMKALTRLLKERKEKRKLGSTYADLMDQVDGLKHALGDFGNTALGQAAISAAANGEAHA